jgi:hypothetical protein
VTDDDRERLRRIAYGPGASAKERASAEASLRESDESATSDSEDHHETEFASEVVSDVHGGEVDSEENVPAEESLWRRRIRLGWLVPVAIGALLVGFVGASGLAGKFDSTAGTSSWSGALTVGPGNVNAANSWFATSATSADAYPLIKSLAAIGVTQSDVRVALNDDGRKLWVVRQGTRGFCLGIYDTNSDSDPFSCVTIQEFEQTGVTLSERGYAAWWGGKGVVTKRAAS